MDNNDKKVANISLGTAVFLIILFVFVNFLIILWTYTYILNESNRNDSTSTFQNEQKIQSSLYSNSTSNGTEKN